VTSVCFFWHTAWVNFLHDGKVKILESKKGGDKNGAETNCQHDAHEAAVDDRVQAVACNENIWAELL
jgi:hypothetical protein